jgi:hydrogenase nickel incorporation protein HypA/HybF
VHELSVARGIADIVSDLVEPRDRPRIRAITVVVGELSGVVADSLAFCFEAVSTEYSIPSKSLAIQHVPFRCYCRTCQHEFANTMGIVICPVCGGSDTHMLSGRELRVATIDLEDETEEGPGDRAAPMR